MNQRCPSLPVLLYLKKMINFLKTEWPLYRIKVTINVSISLRERENPLKMLNNEFQKKSMYSLLEMKTFFIVALLTKK